jgi:hypothetical protein
MRPGENQSSDQQRQKQTGWPEYFPANSLARAGGRLRLHTNSANQKHVSQSSAMCREPQPKLPVSGRSTWWGRRAARRPRGVHQRPVHAAKNSLTANAGGLECGGSQCNLSLSKSTRRRCEPRGCIMSARVLWRWAVEQLQTKIYNPSPTSAVGFLFTRKPLRSG